MDLVTALICVTVATVSTIVIYLISVNSMKEKTYDEVKAEHKKIAEEYVAQGRSAKEKAKDKKLKKAGKKVKEKTSSESHGVSSEEIDSAKGHVAFLDPPVVDEEPVVIEEKKKKKNKKKEKPILTNKNEITLVVDVPPPISNHFEQIVPKDDFSLKRSTGREEIEVKTSEAPPTSQKLSSTKQAKTPANPTKEAKVEKTQKQAQQPQKSDKTATLPKPKDKLITKPQEKAPTQPKLVEEVVVKSSVKQTQNAVPPATSDNASPSAKINRKKRSELTTLQQMSGDKEAVNVNLLMPLVHKAELSRTEIQVLIDLLLNKQQGSSIDSAEWIEGRQDPVVKLKKQLAEKEKALTEEQEAATALQSKLKELRSELNSERHATRTLEESLTARQAELSSLGGKLQHTADEKEALLHQIHQLQAKLAEEHMMLCKLQEDQGQTQGVMQQELLAQRQQLELHIARLTEQHQETIVALEAQMGQMASQLQEREAVNSSLSGELALVRERGAHLQDSAAQSQDLARQVKELHSEMERLISKSQYDLGRLQGEVSSLTEQLSRERAESDKLTSLVQTLQADNNRLTHQISSACVEAQQLRDENETLAAQVTASMERPATEGRENGDVAYTESKHLDNNSDKIHEKELLVEQLRSDIVSKEKEINHFKTDIAQKESLVNSLKGDLDVAHSNAEKMLKEITSYKCIVQDQESVIKALRDEGDSAHKLVNTLREDIGKNKAELMRLSKDCATREQLENRESMIEKLTSELNTHKTKLADQSSLILALEKEVDKYKASLEDKSKDEKLNNYKIELSEKEATIKSLKSQTNTYLAEVTQLRNELISSKEAVVKLSQEVKECMDNQTSLSRELDIQKRKNDELRSKNRKVMEALSTTEKTLETKMKQSQRLVSESEESARLEEQERTKQFLQRILPHVSVDSKEDFETWLEQFMARARESGGDDKGSSAMLAQLEQQNCQLQAMVTHYKAIIADTEGMLNRLQSHVEQEEGRWGQQIQTLTAQLEAVIQERDRLEVNGPSTVDGGSDTN